MQCTVLPNGQEDGYGKLYFFEEVYFKDIIERYQIGLPEVLGELTDDFLNCFI